MDVKLIRAELKDLDKIIEGQKASFYDCYQRYQDHEMSPYNVTYDTIKRILENEYLYKIMYGDEPAGAIYVRQNPDKYNMRLHCIFIIPEYQNKGIGQKAIKLVEEQFSDAVTWALETPHDLQRNHHVYEKMGYKRTGQIDYVNENLSIVHFIREL
ncbi:MAG: GNAT family N-acetyltransferase [Bacillota bacterium]|nr:GNAT family N-acetyltransferase [Bacillota bacterium]